MNTGIDIQSNRQLNYVYQTTSIYNYVHVVFILRFKKGHTNYELKGHFLCGEFYNTLHYPNNI